MTFQLLRSLFLYYSLNVLAIIAAILLLRVYAAADSAEAIRMACLVSVITLPVFQSQGNKSKRMLVASIVGSFLEPFVIFFIWNAFQ